MADRVKKAGRFFRSLAAGWYPERVMRARHKLSLFLVFSACAEAPPPAPEPGGTGVAAPTPTVVVPPIDSVVLVTIDTLRADVLGAYGGRARTPVLDALAGRGWLFEQCFSTSMITNASHASILTSLYPRDHGVQDNESGIADGVETLASALEPHGFRTGAVINFPHLNPGVANLGRGFQRVVEARRKERRADELSREALALLDELGQGERFFLWLHYTDPHAPYDPPASHPPRPPPTATRTPMAVAAKAAPGFQRNNPWFKQVFATVPHVELLVERYVAEVEAADAGLGLLLDGLRARGRSARTAIIVTADHGENLGEHQLYFNHGGLHRETLHVPLIVALPGATPLRLGQLVSSVDIAPTVLELLGRPRWEPMRGESLVPLARDGAAGRPVVYSEHMLAQAVAARSERGALIVERKTTRQFPTYPFSAGRQRVFDLSRDPRELTPLPVEQDPGPTLEAALRDYLAAGLRLAARPAIDQDRESLRALGYVE